MEEKYQCLQKNLATLISLHIEKNKVKLKNSTALRLFYKMHYYKLMNS